MVVGFMEFKPFPSATVVCEFVKPPLSHLLSNLPFHILAGHFWNVGFQLIDPLTSCLTQNFNTVLCPIALVENLYFSNLNTPHPNLPQKCKIKYILKNVPAVMKCISGWLCRSENSGKANQIWEGNSLFNEAFFIFSSFSIISLHRFRSCVKGESPRRVVGL
jgi:hypothetical protein